MAYVSRTARDHGHHLPHGDRRIRRRGALSRTVAQHQPQTLLPAGGLRAGRRDRIRTAARIRAARAGTSGRADSNSRADMNSRKDLNILADSNSLMDSNSRAHRYGCARIASYLAVPGRYCALPHRSTRIRQDAPPSNPVLATQNVYLQHGTGAMLQQ